MKIIVLDGYGLNPGDLSWKDLEQLGEVTVYPRTHTEEIPTRAHEAEIILTNKTVITAETLAQLPALRYIGVLATGYNVVDTEAAKSKGIIVCNIPTYSTASVAQMVFAHLLAITNRVEHYSEENRKGKWSTCPDFCYWDTPLTELNGKAMGIVGLGHTGMATARIAQAFGMQVKAYTSKSPAQIGTEIQKVSLEELFRQCDVISLNCPLTPQTQELINLSALRQMKPGAILINTGRGGLINEKDVAYALQQKLISAYGADVLSVEPAQADNPLLKAPHVFLTPHIAWATKEARIRLMKICCENIQAYQAGKPQNIVNP